VSDDHRLPCDVVINTITYRKGVKLDLLVDAARRWHSGYTASRAELRLGIAALVAPRAWRRANPDSVDLFRQRSALAKADQILSLIFPEEPHV